MAWFDDLFLPGATVQGRFGWALNDSADADDAPDLQAAEGTVTFTSTAPAVRVDGAWVGIKPVTAVIVSGEIGIYDQGELLPLRLLSTDADTGVPDWGWKASFQIDGARIRPTAPFKAPAGSTVNLTGNELIPITGLPVEIIGAGAMDRLVTAEDLLAAHGTRIASVETRVSTVETRVTTVETTVDRIKLANVSAGEGAPSGTAPVGWRYLDLATGDTYRMEA